MLNEEGATSEAQLLELLALRAAGLPPRKLLRLFLSDEAKPAELPLDLPKDIDCYREMIERALPLAEEEFARCRQAGITLLPYFASDYPTALHALGGARPVLLYAKGNLGLLQSPASILGIVGTRQPSPEGLAAAHRIAYEEAEKGRVILSGLAYGCDAAAHHGALEATGRTIAVIATGLDRAHPEAH
ncbi:DNA-processing protein DprA, partial [Porphyromonas sp.]